MSEFFNEISMIFCLSEQTDTIFHIDYQCRAFKPKPKYLGSSLVTIGPSSHLLIYVDNKFIKIHY